MSVIDRYIEGLEWAATVFKERLVALTVILTGTVLVGNVALFWVHDYPRDMMNAQAFTLAMAVFILGFVFVALPLIHVAREAENRD